MNWRSIFISGLLSLTTHSSCGTYIATKNNCIQVRGTKYTARSENGLRFQRHREEILQLPRKKLGLNPDKARNTTGIFLVFRTDSKTIGARFNILSANYMGSAFGIFENGKLVSTFEFKPKAEVAELVFECLTNGVSLFEIALPSFANVEFQGLDIDNQARLFAPVNPAKPVYMALGDSISHGTGQAGASHTTWPFLLSRKLDMEFFNLAVGGGKISVPTGQMLEDWGKIDLITILIGYNDLHFDAKTAQEYRIKYTELLDAIRVGHPETPIFCISMLYTRRPLNEDTGISAAEFRKTLADLPRKRQKTDRHLFFIAGDQITSEKNLRTGQPGDPVHLGVDAAAMLVGDLYRIIASQLNKEEISSSLLNASDIK